MQYLLAAMKSRTDALAVLNRLRAEGVRAALVPTPRQVNVGCGLSVKTFVSAEAALRRAIAFVRPQSFIGIYLVTVTCGRCVVRRI